MCYKLSCQFFMASELLLIKQCVLPKYYATLYIFLNYESLGDFTICLS